MDLFNQAGLYLHIPFCRKKCGYCSFFSLIPQPGDIRWFAEALRLQILQTAALPEVRELGFSTLFIGGGTPTMLASELLADLLVLCRRTFSWSTPEPEISIEVNPGTIDAGGLAELRRAGFNRLSIGIQSLHDDELRRLGRIHSRDQALVTVRCAREAGFDNLSCDLMYGLPGQSPDSWSQSLEVILDCLPQHLSLYELTVEQGTPLWDAVRRNHCILPPEEEVLVMMAATETLVDQGDLPRYEISNYAIPGYRCRHNLNYWHNGFYLGLGPGAVSALGGERRAAVADLQQYCRLVSCGQPLWEDVEHLETEAAFRETVVMGLRMTDGVSMAELAHRFGMDLPSYYGPVVTRLLAQGYLKRHSGRIMLSSRGLVLANQVMAELV